RAQALEADRIHLVIGHGAEQVRSGLKGDNLVWAVQEQQLGTGHAVAQALPNIPDATTVLILYGDVPLTREQTLRDLLAVAANGKLGLITVRLANPTGYGRIVRNAQGQIQAIVEHKDANAEQLAIDEVNTGIMAVSSDLLKRWLPKLSNSNAQGEYYLTDIIAMAVQDDVAVTAVHPGCEEEVMGVNNRLQLAELERWFQRQEADRLMTAGA